MTDNPLALVTGASSGIGLEIARDLAGRGYDLVVCSDEQDQLADATVSLRRDGLAVHAVTADLATPDGVEQLVAATRGLGRPLDALVLNAGIANGGPFLETSMYGDRRVIDLNITAVVHLAKELLPAMVERGAGRVLMTASVASLMPGPYYATYAASKAFVLSFAEAVRSELADTGVTVTALLPGPTDTEFFERAEMEETRAGQGPKDDPAKVAAEAVEGMLDGDEKVVVASLKARSQAALGAVLPDKVKAAVHGAMTKPQGEDG